MKRRTFKLHLAGLVAPSLEPSEITSLDYDDSEEVNLVRYEDWCYDIPTGRWVMKLDWMNKGTMLWRRLGCTKCDNVTPSKMIFYLKNNLIFMKALKEARQHPSNTCRPIINGEEYNLFNMEEN